MCVMKLLLFVVVIVRVGGVWCLVRCSRVCVSFSGVVLWLIVSVL